MGSATWGVWPAVEGRERAKQGRPWRACGGTQQRRVLDGHLNGQWEWGAIMQTMALREFGPAADPGPPSSDARWVRKHAHLLESGMMEYRKLGQTDIEVSLLALGSGMLPEVLYGGSRTMQSRLRPYGPRWMRGSTSSTLRRGMRMGIRRGCWGGVWCCATLTTTEISICFLRITRCFLHSFFPRHGNPAHRVSSATIHRRRTTGCR